MNETRQRQQRSGRAGDAWPRPGHVTPRCTAPSWPRSGAHGFRARGCRCPPRALTVGDPDLSRAEVNPSITFLKIKFLLVSMATLQRVKWNLESSCQKRNIIKVYKRHMA